MNLVSSDRVIPIPLRPALTMDFKDEVKDDSALWLLHLLVYGNTELRSRTYSEFNAENKNLSHSVFFSTFSIYFCSSLLKIWNCQ